jgi:hypothetical protein
MASVKFSSITFSALKEEIERFLRERFNKANVLFSPASPYGQILSVVENLYQMSILYLKNAISTFDLSSPNSFNPRVIRNTAILAGHIPGRSISSSGTLKLTLKSDINIESIIPGLRFTVFNKSLLRNRTNSLDYTINIGSEKNTYRITPNFSFFLPIIQGRWITKRFTGDGTKNQTISVTDNTSKDIENFYVEIKINGELWDIKKHLYDLLPDEESCVVRTGFNGGIDVIFGNEGFGKVPPIGSLIEVSYLLTDGSRGNIFRRTRNDWSFIDNIVAGNGETIDISNVFDIDIYTDINFGADAESIQFTKSLLPIASNNFVLGLPQQYAYEIKKLGIFSHVNAYEKFNSIFVVATPNVKLFKNQNSDYFTVDIRAFELDSYEKDKIDKYLRINGNLQLTKRYRIDSPKLSYYIMNVFVIPYSDATDESVNAQILDKISEYFLNLTRIDRIPKLDIIRELSTISDIHSVDIQFISKKNEDYHREFLNNIKNNLEDLNTTFNTQIKYPNNYDNNKVIGIDPILGDIMFDPEELPILRGGWFDRNSVYYSNKIEGSQLKSVNIIKKGVIDSKNRPV